MPKPQRLPGPKLETVIEKIEDPSTRDAIFELLTRTREVVNPLRKRVETLEDEVRTLRNKLRHANAFEDLENA